MMQRRSKSWEGKPAELIEHYGMGVSYIKDAVMRTLKRKA